MRSLKTKEDVDIYMSFVESLETSTTKIYGNTHSQIASSYFLIESFLLLMMSTSAQKIKFHLDFINPNEKGYQTVDMISRIELVGAREEENQLLSYLLNDKKLLRFLNNNADTVEIFTSNSNSPFNRTTDLNFHKIHEHYLSNYLTFSDDFMKIFHKEYAKIKNQYDAVMDVIDEKRKLSDTIAKKPSALMALNKI